MKHLFIAIGFMLVFSSCSTTMYTQLFMVKPETAVKDVEESFVYENDTIKIVYDFWSKQGEISMDITNKLSIPIYIDWKKCSYIRDGYKYNYWQNETVTNGSSYSSGSLYKGYFSVNYSGNSHSSSSVVTPERITFLPPKSQMIVTRFTLMPNIGIAIDKSKMVYNEVERTDNPAQKTSVFYRNYKPDESILNFRNYLTISTSDDFKTESHIDNGFYVSQITTMETRQFKGKCEDRNGKYECGYPYTDARGFYINIDYRQSKEMGTHYFPGK